MSAASRQSVVVEPAKVTEPQEARPAFMTIMRAPTRRMTKLIRSDGKLDPAESCLTFELLAMLIPGATLSGIWDLLRKKLLASSDSFVVRGAPIGPDHQRHVRRTLNGPSATLRDAARCWLAVDIDEVEIPQGTDVGDLQACWRIARQGLPDAFHEATCIVQATGGHGIKPGARLRLWFWLSRPITCAEADVWLTGSGADGSLNNPVQIIFTAAPVREDGKPDHLVDRLAWVDGRGDVAVPEDLTAPPKPLRASGLVTASDDDVQAALSAIPPQSGYADWVKVVMAIFASTGGSINGRAMAAAWSATDPRYPEAEDATWTKWSQLEDTPPTNIGFGTLAHLARQACPHWRQPSSVLAIDDFEPLAPANENPALQVAWPCGFAMRPDGLFFQADSEHLALRISDPFQVLALSRDESSSSWGKLLAWHDRDGARHQWAMPDRVLQREGTALVEELAEGGLAVTPTRKARDYLREALTAVEVQRRVKCVRSSGWHATESGAAFLIPGQNAMGPGRDKVVMQTMHMAASNAYGSCGDIASWQRISSLAVGNSRLCTFIAASLAGALLDVVGDLGGGIHLVGDSQTGKSTAAVLAASVWGPPARQMRSWRGTANGLEAAAAESTDTVLILDEINQASGKEIGDVVYTVANGDGKARANTSGDARARKTWRAFLLSTGETSLESKMAEAGEKVKAGQLVRLAQIPADAGRGLGVFEHIHAFPHSRDFANHLRDAVVHSHGTAGPAFVERLAMERVSDEEGLRGRIRDFRNRFVRRHVPPDAVGQVTTVAARFALIATAGELAAHWGILPWPAETAMNAAAVALTAWLDQRGNVLASEDTEAVERLRRFLEAHGESRFTSVSGDPLIRESVASSSVKTINRVGYRTRTEAGWSYHVFTGSWKDEVFAGLDASRAARVLAAQGFIERDGTRLTKRCRIEGAQNRFYVVKAAFMSDDAEEDAAWL